MATIKDVAKLAHVSVATVSRVINKKGYVNETTRELVLEAVNELQYVPNELARSLFKKQSRIIGIIVPHLTSYYFAELLEVIEDITVYHNYRLMVCNSQDNKERETKYLQVFQQYNIDGVILISNTTRIQDYKSLSIPIIAIDHKLTEDVPSVTSNNTMGGRLAAQKLVDCGCKKIIHFRGPSVLMPVQDRTNGFKSVLEKHKIFNFSFDLRLQESVPGRHSKRRQFESGLRRHLLRLRHHRVKRHSMFEESRPPRSRRRPSHRLRQHRTVPHLFAQTDDDFPIDQENRSIRRRYVGQADEQRTDRTFHVQIDVTLIERETTK
jgi:DNA-binding LacI/PurR family transcriptional regulator